MVEPDEIATHDGGASPETGHVWQYTQKIWRFEGSYGVNAITHYEPSTGMTDLWDINIVDPGGEFPCPHGDVDRIVAVDDETLAEVVDQVAGIPSEGSS